MTHIQCCALWENNGHKYLKDYTWWEIHEENAAQSWGLKYLRYIMVEASPNNDWWNYSAYTPIGDAQRKMGFLFGHHGQAQIVIGVCIWVQKPCYQK
jgi:hypothetical protein